jgi:FKBP-type peptidyl-prolyl cis-trans isomerase SlyD
VEVIPAEEAIEYLHGADNIIPGLEDALEGKKAGDSFAVTVPAEMGYGEYDAEEVDTIPLSEFEMDTSDIELGDELELWNEEEGVMFEAIVTAIDKVNVTLDFNHPLAGKTLNYQVQVIDVRRATEEEISPSTVPPPRSACRVCSA